MISAAAVGARAPETTDKPLDEPQDGVHDPSMRLVSFLHLAFPRLPFGIRRMAPWVVALVVITSTAGGVPASADDEPAAPAVSEAPRTEPTRNLDAMLELLARAPDAASAAAARVRVLAMWDASGSATADLLQSRAEQALAARDTALALDLLDAAIVVAPKWPGGRHGRAALHVLRNEYGPAIADLRGVLALEPRHFPALIMLSSLLEQVDRKREALDLLRRAAVLDPHGEGLSERLSRLTIEVEGREL